MWFDGHEIMRRKFTITPELPNRSILNDLYRRTPANICQEMRKRLSAHVFGGAFGKCVHCPQTNYPPRMRYLREDLSSLVKGGAALFTRASADSQETHQKRATSQALILRGAQRR